MRATVATEIHRDCECGAVVWHGRLPSYSERIVCACGRDHSRRPSFVWRLRFVLNQVRRRHTLHGLRWRLNRERHEETDPLRPGEERWTGYNQIAVDAEALPEEERLSRLRELRDDL